MIGEDPPVELLTVTVPESIAGRGLHDTGIESLTGMSVAAVLQKERLTGQLTSETILPAGAELLLLGSVDQRHAFGETLKAPWTRGTGYRLA